MLDCDSDLVDHYRGNSFVSGVPVFSASKAAELRIQIEALEASHTDGAGGHKLAQFFRVNGDVVIPFPAEVSRTPAIPDKVETVLGPNLLFWSVELFLKEPHSAKTVSWHQGATYWFMGETGDEVTVWIALSTVSIEAGCMRFIPGSHNGGIESHEDAFDKDNVLSRGQSFAGADEDSAVYGPLKPDEMCLHHGRCFHASGANGSGDRRIGLAIRYLTPTDRDHTPGRDWAMPARGEAPAGGWDCIAGRGGLFHSADVALYNRILEGQAATLSAGAGQSVGPYS